MFYHQKVARVRVFADIQNFALRARHSLLPFLGPGKALSSPEKGLRQAFQAWSLCL